VASSTPAPALQPTGRPYLTLVVIGAVIGIPGAFLAALFLGFVHYLEHVFWTDLPSAIGHATPPWYLVIGLPVVGAAVVLAARRLLPGDGGHRPLVGIGGPPTPVRNVLGVVLAAVGTLAFGAVLGPEAPVVAVGSAVGLAVIVVVKRAAPAAPILGTAGSLSAVSALFEGPLVAGMLFTEGGLGMGANLLPALLPGLVAAAVGYVIFIGFGSWNGLNAAGLAVPKLPGYHGTHPGDLLTAVVIGVVVAVVIRGVRRLALGIEGTRGSRIPMWLLLVGGGLAVGVIAEIARLFGSDSQEVLFSGQAGVPTIIATDSTKIILITLVAKAIAYAVSLGCGFRGGPIFPALFLGIGLASLPEVWWHASPTLAVAVGAAAGMAAQTELLIAPVLFGLLLVGTAGLDTVSAAVLASGAAYLTTQAIDGRSSGTAAGNAAVSDAPAAAPR